MPLVWAHAEYIKLLRSLEDGAVFDMPPHTLQRYVRGKRTARCRPWRLDHRQAHIPAGRVLRIDMPEPALVLFTRDDWGTQAEVATVDTGLGLHVAEIATEGMTAADRIVFTWRTPATGEWHGLNYEVAVVV